MSDTFYKSLSNSDKRVFFANIRTLDAADVLVPRSNIQLKEGEPALTMQEFSLLAVMERHQKRKKK